MSDNFSVDLHKLQHQQTQDPVLKTVYHWIRHNAEPEYPTSLIHGSLFLHAFYKVFSEFFIDDSTNLISLYTKNKPFSDTQSNTTPPLVYSDIRICLPFRLFKTAFNKFHAHCHTGTKITYNTFSQYYYIPSLKKWLSIFIHDCLECERNRQFNMKIKSAHIHSFSEHAPSFNYLISMDNKGPITPSSQNKSFIHVIVDAFSHFVVTVPIKSNNPKTVVRTLLHHWIVKYGSPIYLVTDRGSDYINTNMAHLCTLMGIRHSPRRPYSSWTYGLVEVQTKNLGTKHSFGHIKQQDWAHQVLMYAFAQNSQPLSALNVSPHELVFIYDLEFI